MREDAFTAALMVDLKMYSPTEEETMAIQRSGSFLWSIVPVLFVFLLITGNQAPVMVALSIPPATSHRTGTIVFHAQSGSTNQIYAVAADGLNVRRLTDIGANDFPVVSPDGKSIVFQSTRDNDLELYIMHSDGSDQRRLTLNKGIDFQPTWSPDSKQIAFVSNRSVPYVIDDNIYLMNADGSNQRQLTHGGHDFAPTWSPDGNFIAFRAGPMDDTAIYAMRADGTDLRQLGLGPVPDDGPVWSADSKHIFFCADDPQKPDTHIMDHNRNIYAVDTNGNNLRRLTPDSYFNSCPVVSPDGKHLAFESYRAGKINIYIMDIDGSNLHRLTNNLSDGGLIWSPDSTSIVFMSNNNQSDSKSWKIFIMQIDGSNQQYLADIADNGVLGWIP